MSDADARSRLRFVGKVALITGAASGIGRAVALRLAGEGADVLACDIAESDLMLTCDQTPRDVGSLQPFVMDVAVPETCRSAVAACVEAFGRLDVLGNVAGIARAAHFAETTEAEYRRLMAVNVDGPFFLTKAALPQLIANGGNVVSIASVAAFKGLAYMAPYCMSKAAIVQMTKALAMELIKTPVRVNAIAPGSIQTAITGSIEFPPDIDPELRARYRPDRSPGSPDDIARLFCFIASDDGCNLHGAVIVSDQGATAG